METESAAELGDFIKKSAKILVIDDQEGTQSLLKRRLSIYGYHVMQATDFKLATKALAEHGADVIFLNMFIGGNSSHDFLRNLKKNDLHRNIPVVMISSDSDIELVVKCIESGAEDYLIKPLNQTLLRARLANCVAKKEAHDKEIAYLAQIEHGRRQIVAQEKMASLGVLIGSISQELKNPLNFIINYAEVSSEICGELLGKMSASGNGITEREFQDFLPDKLKKLAANVTKIFEYGRDADKIIRFMLDQSNTSGGKKHPGSINKVISQTISILLSAYRNSGVTKLPKIETVFDHAIPHIKISVQTFSKAIYNILDNAVYSVIHKFSNIDEAKILIKTENTPSSLEISIYDNGSGIKQEIKDKIFDPFFTTKPEGAGPGLGLFTAQEIILDHDGNISVISVEGDYAEFLISLKK
ncbi:MAG: hybrid sensor histidine kinase/response regulator [Holosporaceae bacterium]|nr:hybrid sensor histidine kinase/response regulator [Holosporaceae bacterium]